MTTLDVINWPVILVVMILIVSALMSLRINQEYERAVVFRLGRVRGFKGPGLYLLVPWIERRVKIDIRTVTQQLATQETVTRDGLAVKINAVLWYRAAEPDKALVTVQDWNKAVIQAAETALRDIIGQNDLDELLKGRVAINRSLLEVLANAVGRWGIVVDQVEIKDLDIPEQMQRALAREAEAVREKRARAIKAEGELEAAKKLREAAEMIADHPQALELRRLQTFSEIGAEHNSTIVVGLPLETMPSAASVARIAALGPVARAAE